MNIPTLNFKQPTRSLGNPARPLPVSKPNTPPSPAATVEISAQAHSALANSKAPTQARQPENIIWGNSPKR